MLTCVEKNTLQKLHAKQVILPLIVVCCMILKDFAEFSYNISYDLFYVP